MAEHGDVATGPGWELRCGRWQDALSDITECDCLITDPPYSERTHGGQRHRRHDGAVTIATKEGHAIGYESIGSDDVEEFASRWSSAARWFFVMTSHDLWPAFESEFVRCGLYVFAPVPCVQKHLNVRLAGDGPSNWTCYGVVARHRQRVRVGSLPGAYIGKPFDAGENTVTTDKRIVAGGKPLWLMRAIIRDYSRPGDLIVDPCAGGGTTLLAAVMEGRRAIGAEMDCDTFDKAVKRLRRGYTPDLFAAVTDDAPVATQEELF